jgi:hypothetical protein
MTTATNTHQPSELQAIGVTTPHPIRKKTKRIRTTFTPEQLRRLEDEFTQQMYLVGDYRQYLAKTLGLTEGQVKVWFQNRRIKQRKIGKQSY